MSDVIAYDYQGEVFCPECIVPASCAGNDRLDASYDDTLLTREEVLNHQAVALGIDRTNEKSFDQHDFPKRVFATNELLGGGGEWCAHCGKELK